MGTDKTLKIELDKKINKIEEKNNKDNIKYVEPYNKKGINYNDKLDIKNKILENKIYQYNYSFGLEDINNEMIKKYSSENDVDLPNNSMISIINYGSQKYIKSKERNKKLPSLEYIKENNDEETNHDKFKDKMELRNCFINLNKKNNNKINSVVLSNTVCIPTKKILDNKSLFFKTNKVLNLNEIRNIKKQNIFLNKNNSNSYITYEKINFGSNKNMIEPELKKLSPIRLKGNNSANDLIEKRINEIELCFDEDKKIEKLMEKIKDIIPFEEKLSLSDRTNIKNIFSKKNNFKQKKKQ